METRFPRHVLSAKQFCDKNHLSRVFEEARKFEDMGSDGIFPKIMEGREMAMLSYEPSTRTRFSFEMAMVKLGGRKVSTENASQFSSAAKGENLEDTIKVISGYHPYVIVLRHPEIGAANRAAKVSSVPIINAGDGAGEHPTQMLLDLYTINRFRGNLYSLTVAFVGDLCFGRTIHSLIYPLSCPDICPNAKIYGVSPHGLVLPDEYKNILARNGVPFLEARSIKEIADKVDVLYVTRTQKERFGKNPLRRLADLLSGNFKKNDNSFIMNAGVLPLLKQNAIIMHPLPRTNELAGEVDNDPRAVYFKQAQYGLYVRMAILKLLLNSEHDYFRK